MSNKPTHREIGWRGASPNDKIPLEEESAAEGKIPEGCKGTHGW